MTDESPVSYIDAISQRYKSLGYDPYRWYQADSPPAFSALSKPVAQSRIGVLATSGTYVAGQVAYHYKDDTSMRRIGKDTPTDQLRFAHITENYLEDSRRDPNCTFPIDALRSAESQGRIGELADDLLSCMGGIYSQRRVREELIPAVHERLKAQQVDAVLLIPM
jgi:D-proline reductase (dithiol) PrdB